MKKKITETLLTRRSYFKRSAKNLAEKFGCKEVTVKKILKDLAPLKKEYLQSLKTSAAN